MEQSGEQEAEGLSGEKAPQRMDAHSIGSVTEMDLLGSHNSMGELLFLLKSLDLLIMLPWFRHMFVLSHLAGRTAESPAFRLLLLCSKPQLLAKATCLCTRPLNPSAKGGHPPIQASGACSAARIPASSPFLAPRLQKCLWLLVADCSCGTGSILLEGTFIFWRPSTSTLPKLCPLGK